VTKSAVLLHGIGNAALVQIQPDKKIIKKMFEWKSILLKSHKVSIK
jgi:hypothetical protein